MNDKRHNGWTNVETWLVAIWADKGGASYRHRERLAQQTWRNTNADGTLTRNERDTIALANSLRLETKYDNPFAEDDSLWADLIGAALAEVNWYEIAERSLQYVRNLLPSLNKRDTEGS
jgi:hypothetical protein